MQSRDSSMLKPGEVAVVKSLTDSRLSAKLLEMGFLPGKKVKLIRTAPGGSPLYFDIEGQYVALRKEEAGNIALVEVAQ